MHKNKEENDSTLKALIYCRVSSERQKKEGHGLDSQEQRCRAYAQENGYCVERVFKDSFSGGGDFMKRPAMSEMLGYVDDKAHNEYTIIFDDLKRFARDTEFHLKLRTALKSRNVTPKCLNFNFEDTPEGRYVETVLAAGAELERNQNKRQVIQKQKARLENGYWPFGAKKGYRMVKEPEHGKIAVPHEKEAPLLKNALEGFAKGTFVRKLDACKYLVQNGFWARKESPEKYTDKFTEMATNPFYAGYIEYPKWEVGRVLGKHKPIISLETFNLIQKRLKNELSGKRIRRDINEDFPLRGLLVCDFCDKHITGAWSQGRRKKHAYYFCQNKKCPQRGKAFRRKDLDDSFRNLLIKQKLKPGTEDLIELVFERAWRDEVSKIRHYKSNLLSEKCTLEDKLKQLSDLAIKTNNSVVRAVYENQMVEISKEIDLISKEQAVHFDYDARYQTTLNKAVTFLRSPYVIWESLDVIEQHRLFYFIFERKLPYHKDKGYRTDKIPSAVRLFEEFVTTNSHDVEMRSKMLNRLKDYLSRFHDYYNSSPALQKILT